jgi:hypothetical protein
LRALGSNASRLIVGLVAPHREQRARQTTRGATMATFFPRRRATACAHRRNASVRGSEARHTRQAACTSHDCRCGCALRTTRPRR